MLQVWIFLSVNKLRSMTHFFESGRPKKLSLRNVQECSSPENRQRYKVRWRHWFVTRNTLKEVFKSIYFFTGKYLDIIAFCRKLFKMLILCKFPVFLFVFFSVFISVNFQDILLLAIPYMVTCACLKNIYMIFFNILS